MRLGTGGDPMFQNPESKPYTERSFGLHLGLNVVPLIVDVQFKRFYAFGSANLGLIAATVGSTVTLNFGAGVSFTVARAPDAVWTLELFAMGTPGWNSRFDWLDRRFFAAGLGAGARYIHRSGFVFAFKLPLFGVTALSQADAPLLGGKSISQFYLAAAIGLPLFSLGYNF